MNEIIVMFLAFITAVVGLFLVIAGISDQKSSKSQRIINAVIGTAVLTFVALMLTGVTP